MRSKYFNISYPIFALKKKPINIIYSIDKIQIIKNDKDSHIETIDDKKLSGDYFARLLQMSTRATFDLTCKDMQELVISKAKWGIDKNAIPHDFTTTQAFKADIRKVDRIKENIIWLKNISYPFIIPTNEVIELSDDLYAIIVNIDNEWVIREFSYEPYLHTKVVQI